MELSTRRVDNVPGVQKRSTSIKISMYAAAPEEEISLDEFELFALDRLQLLRGIESLKTRGIDGAELNTKLNQLENKYMPMRTREQIGDNRKDQISHFILRLAYCWNEDLRRWFLTHESHLFKFRLDRLSDQDRADFMIANGLSFEQLSSEAKTDLKDKLIGLAGVEESKFPSAIYYKVPFALALSLIGSRSVYLERGFAYVPLSKLVSIITSKFKIHLTRSLAEAAHMFEPVSSDPRIGALLKNMSKQYVGKDFTASKTSALDKLYPEQVDEAAERHMPLCMKYLHSNLKRDGKLKHWGRLQYGLFLKGAGLELENAILFWQSFFTKVMSADAFSKQYAYSFRHMYGKEGSRKNYTPFSCYKIIMGTPPEPGAFHGCPFRHMPDNQLAAQLEALKMPSSEVQELVRTAKSGNPQIACQRHFDWAHPGHQTMVVEGGGRLAEAANHPNQWYQSSVLYYRTKNGISSTSSASVKSETPPAGGVGSAEAVAPSVEATG